MYYKLNDVKKELDELRENGLQRGYSIGFDWKDLPYTIKLGSCTYVGAPPGTGKTEFQKEILINSSCLHGWKHVIFSPETGSASEIFAELCSSYIGKPYLKGYNQMSQSEMVQAEYFVSEHFYIIGNTDIEVDLKMFYSIVDEIEFSEDVKIHTTTIDPWNELNELFEKSDLGREDKYLSRMLGYANKNAKKTMRHNFIVTHIRDQSPITESGITYFPFPHAREMSGGQTWFRKGMTVILLWRPPLGLSGSDGDPYLENELHIRIGKVKPKGTSKKGTYKIYLDTDTYQYYVINSGRKIYANRGKGSIIKDIKPLDLNTIKNIDFDSLEDDSPF